MNLLEREIVRQARGICAIASVLGWPLTCAMLVMALALLALALAFRGPWVFLALAVLILLAIRAHDLGELPAAASDDPSEFSTFWQPPTDAEEQRRAAAAQAAFLSVRDAAALGRPHDPQEL